MGRPDKKSVLIYVTCLFEELTDKPKSMNQSGAAYRSTSQSDSAYRSASQSESAYRSTSQSDAAYRSKSQSDVTDGKASTPQIVIEVRSN